MSKIYQEQWGEKTYIGYYLKPRFSKLLSLELTPTWDTYLKLLSDGVEQYNEIDFIISAPEQAVLQEFQLKRLGPGGIKITTEALADYINGVKNKYSKNDSALLIEISRLPDIDFPRLEKLVVKEDVPFGEILLIGLGNDSTVFVVGLKPDPGFSVYSVEQLLA